jgi:hypothetical protein
LDEWGLGGRNLGIIITWFFIVAIVLALFFYALKLGNNYDETIPEDYRQAT